MIPSFFPMGSEAMAAEKSKKSSHTHARIKTANAKLYFIFVNTCWAPHLEMSPERFTMATIALFSASEQTSCALVVCDSE